MLKREYFGALHYAAIVDKKDRLVVCFRFDPCEFVFLLSVKKKEAEKRRGAPTVHPEEIKYM